MRGKFRSRLPGCSSSVSLCAACSAAKLMKMFRFREPRLQVSCSNERKHCAPMPHSILPSTTFYILSNKFSKRR